MILPPQVRSERLRARLVDAASDLGASMEPLAQLYVSDAAGALRTILGDAHQHPVGSYPSWKTGLSQPYDGVVEPGLIYESEVDAQVVDYQTQAFRLRMAIMGGSAEWICDHLRQMRNGTVEAIEVKRTPADLDPAYIIKMQLAREILGRAGIELLVKYDEEINGNGCLVRSRGHVLAHRSYHVDDAAFARFEQVYRRTDTILLGELQAVLDPRRVAGRAAIHSLMCAGRVECDRTMPMHEGTELTLLAPFSFNSKIRF